MGDSRAIRTKFSLALLTSGILAMVILPGVANGMSPNTFCGDEAGLEIISSGTFVNIIVPSPNDNDGQCKLTGTVHVTGNVKVNPDGELQVTDGVVIDGNLQAKGAAEIYVGTIVGPIIGGNVQIGGSTDDVTIEGSSIGGDIRIKDQSAGIILIDGNDVSGSIKLRGNTAEVIDIIENDVDGDIKLEDNEGTSPSDGEPINVLKNLVDGNLELHNNLVSGLRDINVERNVVGGDVILDGNESANDDIEFEDNDVGGDLTVINNKADENGDGSGNADIDVENTCMTGNGNVLVKNNVAGQSIEVDEIGDIGAGADFECDDIPGAGGLPNGQATNVTVEGNTAIDDEFDLDDNNVLGDYTIEGNTVEGDGDFLINDNDVVGDLTVIDNTIIGTGDIQVMDNTGGDELLCSGNDPDPTDSGNTGFTTDNCDG